MAFELLNRNSDNHHSDWCHLKRTFWVTSFWLAAFVLTSFWLTSFVQMTWHCIFLKAFVNSFPIYCKWNTLVKLHDRLLYRTYCQRSLTSVWNCYKCFPLILLKPSCVGINSLPVVQVESMQTEYIKVYVKNLWLSLSLVLNVLLCDKIIDACPIPRLKSNNTILNWVQSSPFVSKYLLSTFVKELFHGPI